MYNLYFLRAVARIAPHALRKKGIRRMRIRAYRNGIMLMFQYFVHDITRMDAEWKSVPKDEEHRKIWDISILDEESGDSKSTWV